MVFVRNTYVKTCICIVLLVALFLTFQYKKEIFDGHKGIDKELQQSNVEIVHATNVSFPAVYSYDSDKAWLTSDTCRTFNRKMHMEDFVRLTLLTPVGNLPVYVHNPKRDGVSSRVYKSGKFEPEILNIILLFLRTSDQINFIDIGANIGLHTLPVLKIGRKVIALEAAENNVVHICDSAHDLGFQNNLHVIQNVVGSNHQPSMFYLGKDGRFGGSFVDFGGDSKITQNKFREDGDIYQSKLTPMPTVIIDDLFSMPDKVFFTEFGTNFIKIDVEGSEMKVLEGAKKFLETTKNIGIIMEWRWHRGQPSAKLIVDILRPLGYEAYNPDFRSQKYKTQQPTMPELKNVFTHKLDYSSTASWPHDVVWISNKL